MQAYESTGKEGYIYMSHKYTILLGRKYLAPTEIWYESIALEELSPFWQLEELHVASHSQPQQL